MLNSILKTLLYLFFCEVLSAIPLMAKEGYKNFDLVIYCPQFDMRRMQDAEWLEATYTELSRSLKIEKVYLETFRDNDLIEKEVVLTIKKFFEDRGVKTAGGITYVQSERNRFQTFCYSNPEHRQQVRQIAEHTAALFDEFILDDFFFTNCKCEKCIQAKGNQSWSQFRLDLMTEAAEKLVIQPAKKINPAVKIIIKYPNWYDHFQYCGFNLETQPKMFDLIYTGTETRDPVYTHQHLQPYQSFAIMRYFENVATGRNAGGWVDPYAHRTLDRYAEQIRLTLFAKAREQTLFCWGALVQMIQEDSVAQPLSEFAPVAGHTLEKVDRFLGKLGKPVGVKSYKPYHSFGEDFLINYIGMLGIPIEIVPEFPDAENIIFLTEQARFDKEIVSKIKGQLIQGKEVMVTSGLYKVLQGKGIEDIVELECTDEKAFVRTFYNWWNTSHSENEILIPQIRYATNDSWELITALVSGVGYPILLQASYGNGRLYVLTIPDNFGQLYDLPQEVITSIKRVLLKELFVSTDTPAEVSLFVYDNNTFIVESFLDQRIPVKIVLNQKFSELVSLTSNRELKGQTEWNTTVFQTGLAPHSYEVYQAK